MPADRRFAVWLSNEEPLVRTSPRCEPKEDRAPTIRIRSAPAVPNFQTREELMKVIIGVDPHKASHTAVAIGDDEAELGAVKVRATRGQVPRLLSWAESFEKRT